MRKVEKMSDEIENPPKSKTKLFGFRSVGAFLLSTVLIVMVLRLSWAPASQMSLVAWVPGWIGELADQDPNMRTAVPFIPLAFLLGYSMSGLEGKHGLVLSGLLCLACLLIAELGQVFLPDRTADWEDLLWGSFGILVGTLIANLIRGKSKITSKIE